ncbi:MAG: exonuclease domain-containing protein, partial [Gemmatimonadota bacterium]
MLYFDLETTGTDPDSDRIVELAILDPASGTEDLLLRFDPGVPIPPGASAVHGIRDEDVRGEPRFEERAEAIQALFEERRLCGYNSRSFDTPFLDAALRRAGQPGLDLRNVEEIDLYRVWTAVEPAEGRGNRTLQAAVQHHLGRFHLDAHGAAADAAVLADLLPVMRERYGLTLERMMELTAPPEEVDRAGRLRLEEGEIVFAFGRHAGEPVAEHPDYVDWMLGADFPEETKRVLRRLREGAREWPPG